MAKKAVDVVAVKMVKLTIRFDDGSWTHTIEVPGVVPATVQDAMAYMADIQNNGGVYLHSVSAGKDGVERLKWSFIPAHRIHSVVIEDAE